MAGTSLLYQPPEFIEKCNALKTIGKRRAATGYIQGSSHEGFQSILNAHYRQLTFRANVPD